MKHCWDGAKGLGLNPPIFSGKRLLGVEAKGIGNWELVIGVEACSR